MTPFLATHASPSVFGSTKLHPISQSLEGILSKCLGIPRNPLQILCDTHMLMVPIDSPSPAILRQPEWENLGFYRNLFQILAILKIPLQRVSLNLGLFYVKSSQKNLGISGIPFQIPSELLINNAPVDLTSRS